MNVILEGFSALHPKDTWHTITPNNDVYPGLKTQFTKYQDPHEADAILKARKELAETHVILVLTLINIYHRKTIDPFLYSMKH